MRFSLTALVSMLLLALVVPADCEAVERTAYLFRWDDTTYLSVPLPGPGSGYLEPTIINDLDWSPAGSTMSPDGRILTINAGTDELVAMTVGTGDIEPLSVLDTDVRPYDNDLFWGVDGSLFLYTSNTGDTNFFTVDPDSGSISLQGTSSENFDTIEKHGDLYFGGADNSFWRIDPQTYEATIVHTYAGHYSSCLLWGLTSVGENLWFGMSCSSSGGPETTTIGTIDPLSGQLSEYIFLADFSYVHFYLALEVIEQPGPAEIPILEPIGLLLLVLSFMVAGVLILLRR